MNNDYLIKTGIQYFLEQSISDDEILSIYNCKSGKLAEKFFKLLLDKFCSQHSSQFKYSETFKIDSLTSYSRVAKFDELFNEDTIVEIKNYMYESTGTADEKLEGDIIKYESYITNGKFRHIIIILCAKFERLFITKHMNELIINGYLEKWFNEGIYIAFASDILIDFLCINNMSFIKWVGGKSALMSHINKYIEEYISKNTNEKSIYVEPFLGSGSVLINILKNYSEYFKEFICSDNNKVLIDTFNEIKFNHKNLIYILDLISSHHIKLSSTEQSNFYYECREIYNDLIDKSDVISDHVQTETSNETSNETSDENINENQIKTSNENINEASDETSDENMNENDREYVNAFIEFITGDDIESLNDNQSNQNHEITLKTLTSALFIYLNKTCFRGLYRVNQKNIFNVPYGNYKKPSIINEEQLYDLHKLFAENNVEFRCCSYENNIKIDDYLNEKVLMYLDPPYYKTFDSYTLEKFDHDKFTNYLNMVTNKKYKNLNIILSNSFDYQEIITIYKINLTQIERIPINDRINSKKPDNKRYEILGTNI